MSGFALATSVKKEIKMFTYIFKEKSYSNADKDFMKELGMTDEQIESILSQKEFEESK